MRDAQRQDIPLLVELMAEFYSEAGFALDRDHAGQAFGDLLENPLFGRIWILESGEDAAGHLVITYRYAMEYGGQIACLDDLYVRQCFRNQGIARRAVEAARDLCVARGLRAMSVEVDPMNEPAQRVYRGAGFQAPPGRQLLALPLAQTTHLT